MPVNSPILPLLPDDPARVAGFTLAGRLGSGGMGTVYLARSAGGRLVALKTIHPELADEPGFRDRFRLEAEAARSLGPLHTAEVVDADPDAARPWLATAYLIGPSLRDAVLLGGPLPQETVRGLGAALAEALRALHRSGLAHRDLKPSNVLLTPAGPRLIDFGIARALGARRLTSTGQVIGTPAYMSPEQVRGEEHGPEGDVFALGSVLVFAATGHGPFDGRDGQDPMVLVRDAEPELADLPAGLRDVLTACLHKTPGHRPDPGRIAAAWGPFDAAAFADTLPGPVLADITRRIGELPTAGGVADAGTPARGEPDSAAPAPRPGRLSRRAVLVAAVGGVLATGTAGTLLAAGGFGGSDGSGGGTPAKGSGPASSKGSGGRPPGTAPRPSWSVPLRDAYDDPISADGVAFTSGVALSAKDGSQLWRDNASNVRVAAFDGRAYGMVTDRETGDRSFGRVDLRTGKVAGPAGDPRELDDALFNVIATDGDTVYVHVYDDFGSALSVSRVLAYDVAARRIRWSRPIEAHRDETGSGPFVSATVTGERLVCTDPELMFAFDRRGGEPLWTRRLLDGGDPLDTLGRPVASRTHAYTAASSIWAVDLATGDVTWELESASPLATGFADPVIADGVLYAVDEDLTAHDPLTGGKLWTLRSDLYLSTIAQPDAFKGLLYVGTVEEGVAVVAVDVARREEAWSLSAQAVKSEGGADLVHADGFLYVHETQRLTAVPLD
ncbi:MULTISPECIES: protein kinase domain-containing protein [unclassified Streptomyces]|uniref:serine/threonine-protein kinase n=1 Tax=unclassified Streptomyces TaxID=2593676 RepID=UPI00093B9B5A|nr:serine/threonine-protein kinase [Streptomyces sp. TSRI0107]